MKQEIREQQLKSLAASGHGAALKDWLNIEITRLENVSLIPNEDFENQARAHKLAVGILRKLLRFLNTVNKQTTDREKNPYM